ncbi:MAG: sodium:solute symporter [Alphaproteobacteria bacterium]|nr:MAG: sodium:solute symporter [Alphaproteobacteria bacterium]
MSANILIATALAYVALLFLVAFVADRRAQRGRAQWLRSPIVYTLSISVYCTAWTFYGAVGTAARSGLEFVAIYSGPTLVFIGWWWLLRKLVRISRQQRITSIADLVSSRYGKSPILAIAVTTIAVLGTTPYIALQLQSLTTSFTSLALEGASDLPPGRTAFWVAAGLVLFTILFGTRNIDANERHHGVVTAIALEAVVKLVALVAVGIFVVWWIGEGPANVFARATPDLLSTPDGFGPRWITLTFLSASAVICLPRMFQVTVVENVEERHLFTAAWAFPLYLFLICLFVLPIAIVGRSVLPEGSNPDLFVLSLPLNAGQQGIALLAFIGGFSAATSMVIVAAIALSTMVSNHIVLPIWLARREADASSAGDVRRVLLISRRISIAVVLLLGYIYFRLAGGGGTLASIGVISFAGVAQILPAVLAGIFWRSATKPGAICGVLAGLAIWVYTLFLPSFHGGLLLSDAALAHGPFGIEALRPRALFGLTGLDPLVHAMFWSMLFNVALLVLVSIATGQNPLERLQAALFVDAFRLDESGAPMMRRSAASEDLFALAQRILGRDAARALFDAMARDQGRAGRLPEPTDAVIARLERAMAGAVGAAPAHAMVSRIATGETVSMEALMRIADETAQIVEYSNRLELKSRELEETAAQLRAANLRLQQLGEQKDAFLTQVSHELRTPMTSIRSFSEILRGESDLEEERRARFIAIIHEESQRLTRLLDEILDLSFLESRQVDWQLERLDLEEIVDRALAASEGMIARSGIALQRAPRQSGLWVRAQSDRLAQVLINLISNAVKYAQGEGARLTITTGSESGEHFVEIADNGPGIPPEDRSQIFEKFARARGMTDSRGAGLGLPISREIMRNLGGDVILVPSAQGAVFRVRLPALAAAGAEVPAAG